MKKIQTGIWLDYKEAFVIKLNAEEMQIVKINSEIENFHPKGGSRSKVPYGPMEKISERTFLKRRKQQEKSYFKNLISNINGTDELLIFGPGMAKEGLLKSIKESNNFKGHLSGFETTDNMTDNQKVAKVKSFFQNQ